MADIAACLVDGQSGLQLPVSDRGLHYADGLFETMAWLNGRVPLLDRHWLRLLEGCQRLSLTPPDRRVIDNEIRFVAGDRHRAVVKLILTRGDGARGYRIDPGMPTRRIVLSSRWPDRPTQWHENGIAVRICATRLSVQPRVAGLKTLARLDQVLARGEWQGDEFQEGLMLDPGGRLVCGTMSNIFMVRGSRLITPDLSRCGVAGVMRGLVMELADGAVPTLECRDVDPEELGTCDELMLTNSLSGILPVRQLEGRTVEVGPVTRRLQELARDRLAMR